MAFYSSSKAAKACADRLEEFHRLAGPAVKPCCWFGPAKHTLPTDRANSYYAVKRETSWTYHAKGKHGIRSKWDASSRNSKISAGPVASSAQGILEFHYSDEHRSVTDRSRGKVSAELHE
ncbi:hypothetical protein ALC56_11732 [Trachymyrmex septentrionalis]|uniref:Uncharacterized protein n=1 Tax=Trachymyrmex septentrionalis TaxID=34720 RepID=A0A195F0B4_9HYME|nr:hypothetical protein ALC56_11732 [Trachymyrmex septentrionalis]